MRKLAALAVFMALLLVGGCRGNETGDEAGSSSPSGPRRGSVGPTPTEEVKPSYFPAFWPVATVGEAESMQRAVDGGSEPWRIDPREVAKAYAREAAHWDIRVLSSQIVGSQQSSWTSSVVFQPLIGGAMASNSPGPRHTMTLVGLKGVVRPAWFISSLSTEEIGVDSPSEGQVVSSPLRITGRGRAYEGAVSLRVQDDNGVQLYPRAGEPGMIPVGAGVIETFEASIPLQAASTGGGILIITGDTAAGPDSAIVVFRVRFVEE